MFAECYNQYRQRKLPSMRSHEYMLYHPEHSDNDLGQDIRSTGMDGRWHMGSEVEIWMTGSLLDVSCFLFSSSLLWISAQYKWRRHGFLQPSESIKWRWIFPVRQIGRKVAIELSPSIVGLMGSYDCVRRMIVSYFCFSFLLFSYTGFGSPGGLRLKRGIM
jgi:hypothetical protein